MASQRDLFIEYKESEMKKSKRFISELKETQARAYTGERQGGKCLPIKMWRGGRMKNKKMSLLFLIGGLRGTPPPQKIYIFLQCCRIIFPFKFTELSLVHRISFSKISVTIFSINTNRTENVDFLKHFFFCYSFV